MGPKSYEVKTYLSCECGAAGDITGIAEGQCFECPDCLRRYCVRKNDSGQIELDLVYEKSEEEGR